jgi:hypothetical protein
MPLPNESPGPSHPDEALRVQELRLKRRELWVSSAAVAVPLLLGVATLIAGVLSERSAARLALQLKAVEIVMNAEGAYAAKARAQALVRLFGQDLGPILDTVSTLKEIGAPGRERRLEILRLLAEHPQDCARILGTADVLFPETAFVDSVRSRSPYCKTQK